MLFPVILAGGVGSRLWPMSRALAPKQFIQFPGQTGSLFQSSISRLTGIADLGRPIVVCNENHRFLVAEQLRTLGIADGIILLEPVGRNTAPAVALAAMLALEQDPDATLLVLPSDHVIANEPAFRAGVAEAQALAGSGYLTTFAVVPDSPETGYGYLQKGEDLSVTGAPSAASLKRFVEKPDLQTAQEYFASGEYSWNSGMFLFPASLYLDELQQHAKDIADSCRDSYQAIEVGEDYHRLSLESFTNCRADSIDYAVMEKTDKAAMIPLDADWNDLGAWGALHDIQEKDAAGNAFSGDVVVENVNNSYIQANSRLVTAVGLDNAVIVETADAVLVSSLESVQQIKAIVERLQQQGRDEVEHHSLVYRPWGSYESLAVRGGFQVKHIVVNPGASLSLQLHHHRAEHWTIVKGSGLVHCDGEDTLLHANESIFIPLGSKHRLTNPGTEVVELIEVQIGDYLGEDDIVRFEDIYGRVAAK